MRLPSIVQFPSDKLRRRAEPLSDAAFGTSGLRDYCQVLANLLTAAERADVLAGTMVDFDPAWRVLAMSANNGAVSILCNPEIRDMSGEQIGFEPCASFACVPAVLSAPGRLVVQYRKPDGTRREVVCTRSGARAVFQGVEALNGKIVLDRMSLQMAHQYVRKYREDIEEQLAPRVFLPAVNETLITAPN